MLIQQVAIATPEYEQVWQLRDQVLRKPLGLSLKDEDPAEEAADITFAALQEGAAIGCVMLRPVEENTVKLRQMAVAPGLQGSGIGRLLVLEAEKWAKHHQYTAVVLHARMAAVPFYEKLGYIAYGPVFSEVGIPHIHMEKRGL